MDTKTIIEVGIGGLNTVCLYANENGYAGTLLAACDYNREDRDEQTRAEEYIRHCEEQWDGRLEYGAAML